MSADTKRTSTWSQLVPLLLLVVVPIVLLGQLGSAELISATTSAGITAILVVGLYVFCGNSGVLAFGHVAFVAVGAYACGVLTIPTIAKSAILPNLPDWLLEHSVSPMTGVVVGGLASAVVAAVAFFPLRRLNAQALSIVTLSLLLIAHVFFTNVRLSSSGGAVTRVPIVATLDNVLPWLLVVVVVALIFQRSRLGLRLRASREDEFAAESGGIDIGWTRYAAFVLSATIMGLGGGLFALSLGSFSADDFFLGRTILLFAMMVVGGMRSLTGALVGTYLISTVDYVFGQLENGMTLGGFVWTLPSGAANVSIALCMVLVLLFRRNGLLGDREISLARLLRRRTPDPTPTSATSSGDVEAGTTHLAGSATAQKE